MTTLKDYGFASRFQSAHLSKLDLPDFVAQKIIQWNKNPKGILTLVGNPGIGKTYLCAAIINDRIEKKNFDNRYFRESNFYAEVKKVWALGWDSYEEIKRLCEADLFILDDMLAPYSEVEGQNISKCRQEMIMDAINLRWESEKPTLITSNLWESELKDQFPESFLSRLKDTSNTFIQCEYRDKRQDIPGLDNK